MTFRPITILAALALGVAAPAMAANYTFNYTLLEGGVVNGSFSGNQTGNLITGISNIAVSYNGTPFDGTISAYGYAGYNGPGGPNNTALTDFVLNAATVSFDPLLNNFIFINRIIGSGPENDTFYIIPWTNGGNNQVATQVRLDGSSPNFYNGNYLPQNWSVSEVTAGVPEPASWAMLMIGFGVVGGMTRARSRKVKTYSC